MCERREVVVCERWSYERGGLMREVFACERWSRV